MTPRALTEAELLRRIERARKTQEAAETEEAAIYAEGGTETQVNAARRRANQALWARRKLTKQLETLRAAADAAPRPEGGIDRG